MTYIYSKIIDWLNRNSKSRAPKCPGCWRGYLQYSGMGVYYCNNPYCGKMIIMRLEQRIKEKERE